MHGHRHNNDNNDNTAPPTHVYYLHCLAHTLAPGAALVLSVTLLLAVLVIFITFLLTVLAESIRTINIHVA